MTLLNSAKQLVDLGLSIVPVEHGQKRPICEWKTYQSRRPQFNELLNWFGGNQNLGFGVVCGEVSGNLVCLDLDSPEAANHFAEDPRHAEVMNTAAIAKTSRGTHLFFRSPVPVASQALYLPGFNGKAGDILGDGKFAVLPPTRHPDGFVRQWVRDIARPGAKVPTFSITDLNLGQPPRLSSTGSSVAKGDRHNSMVRFAKENVHRTGGLNDLLNLMQIANEDHYHPPLPYSEVMGIAKHFAGSENHHHSKRIYNDDSFSSSKSIITDLVPLGDDQDDEETFLSAPEYAKSRTEHQMDWLIEGMLPLTYLVVLGATSKSGKSSLVTNLANSVAKGEPFLGLPTVQAPVLWLAYEESKTERLLILTHYLPHCPAHFISHRKIILDSIGGLSLLKEWIHQIGAKLLVIDPLYGAVQAESLSDGRKARTALEGLKEICRKENVAAIVLHHFTKNVAAGSTRERFADSNQILATASMDWIMETRKLPDKTREIRLIGAGRGEFANKTWLIHSRSDHEFELLASGSAAECEQDHIEQQMLQAVQSFDNGATAEEIAERLGVVVGTVRNRLTQMVKANLITVIGKRGRTAVYGADRVLVEAE